MVKTFQTQIQRMSSKKVEPMVEEPGSGSGKEKIVVVEKVTNKRAAWEAAADPPLA